MCSIRLLQCALCCLIFFEYVVLRSCTANCGMSSIFKSQMAVGFSNAIRTYVSFGVFIINKKNPLFHPFDPFQAMRFGSVWFTWLKCSNHQNSICEGTTVEWGSHPTDSIESFPECYNQSFTLRNMVPTLRDQDQNINLWTPTNEWMRIIRYFSAACIRGLRVRVCGEQTVITLYFGIVWIKNKNNNRKTV